MFSWRNKKTIRTLWLKKSVLSGAMQGIACIPVISLVMTGLTLFFDFQGAILSCDDQMAYIHGYISPSELEGSDLKHLIPSFQLPTTGEQLTKVTISFLRVIFPRLHWY